MLIKDKDFQKIEGEVCKLVEFHPIGTVQEGKIKNASILKPYATIVVKCRISKTNLTYAITNKADFVHLWEALRLRRLKENEEALVIWSIKKYSTLGRFIYKYFHGPFPKLTIWICPTKSYEKINNLIPKKDGEAGFLEVAPIAEWKPISNDVLE